MQNILLIASDTTAQSDAITWLKANYPLEVVTDVEKALARADHTPPDMILAEWSEATGNALRRLRERWREIPLVAITDREDIAQALRIRADACLLRPFERSELESLLQKLRKPTAPLSPPEPRRSGVDALLFQGFGRFLGAIRMATAIAPAASDGQAVAERIREAAIQAFDCPRALLFVRIGERFEVVGAPSESTVPASHPLFAALRSVRRPIPIEEIPAIDAASAPESLRLLEHLQLSLVSPLIQGDTLLAVLGLGHKRDNTPYTPMEHQMVATYAAVCSTLLRDQVGEGHAVQAADGGEQPSQATHPSAPTFHEAKERLQEALASWTAVGSEMIHRLRNSLVALQTLVDLKGEANGGDAVTEAIETAGRSLAQLQDFLDQIEALTLPLTLDRQYADLNIILSKALARVKRESGTALEFKVHYAEPLPPLLIDPRWLQRALEQVIRYGARFSGSETPLEIRTEERQKEDLASPVVAVVVSHAPPEGGWEQARAGRWDLEFAQASKIISEHGGAVYTEQDSSHIEHHIEFVPE